MAVTGVILSGFVLAHMAGNLRSSRGPRRSTTTAKLLHKEPALLWTARVVLLAAVGLHIWAYLVADPAEPAGPAAGYRALKHRESSFASRSMRLTGPLLLAFIVYHILHLTTGTVHPDYHEGSVYRTWSPAWGRPGGGDLRPGDGVLGAPPLARGLEHVPDARRDQARYAVAGRDGSRRSSRSSSCWASPRSRWRRWPGSSSNRRSGSPWN